MQVCVWDKAVSSWYNEKEMKGKSSKCFIFWNPSLVVLTETIAKVSGSMQLIVRKGKSFMSRSCPCRLEMSVLLPIKVFTSLRVLLMMIRTRSSYSLFWKNLGPCGQQDECSPSLAIPASLIAGCMSKKKKKRDRGQAIKTDLYFLA